MSTLNVSLPEGLHDQLITMAAREGVSPSEFVAETLAEKLDVVSYADGERPAGGAGETSPDHLAIIHVPDLGGNPHDHLAPYNEA